MEAFFCIGVLLVVGVQFSRLQFLVVFTDALFSFFVLKLYFVLHVFQQCAGFDVQLVWNFKRRSWPCIRFILAIFDQPRSGPLASYLIFILIDLLARPMDSSLDIGEILNFAEDLQEPVFTTETFKDNSELISLQLIEHSIEVVLLGLLLALCGNWLSEVLETIYELVELLAPVNDFHLNVLDVLR